MRKRKRKISTHSRPAKLVVLRLSHLGDLLLIIPALRALRVLYPHAEIVLVTEEEYEPLFSLVSAVDSVVGIKPRELRSCKARQRVVERINGLGPYDPMLDLHNVSRTRALRNSIHARQVLVTNKHTLGRWLLVLLKKDMLPRPWQVAYGHLMPLRALGFAGEMPDHRLEVDNERGLRLAGELGIQMYAPPLAFAPFATRSTKEWHKENYIELARLAVERLGGAVLILGSPAEGERGEALASVLRDGGINALSLAGRVGLGELPHLLSCCRALVGGDTGLAHLASACGIATVAIFGPTTPRLGFAPLGERSAVVERELTCRPCSRHGGERCPLGTLECMREIRPQMVLGALEGLI